MGSVYCPFFLSQEKPSPCKRELFNGYSVRDIEPIRTAKSFSVVNPECERRK